MKRQNLGDLNGYLFEQLERLNDPDMTKEEIALEIDRANAISRVATQAVSAGHLALKAEITYQKHEAINAKMPEMLEADTADKIE